VKDLNESLGNIGGFDDELASKGKRIVAKADELMRSISDF
jgi:hypothetical protein